MNTCFTPTTEETMYSEEPWSRACPRRKHHKSSTTPPHVPRCSVSKHRDSLQTQTGLSDLVDEDDVITLRRKFATVRLSFTRPGPGRRFLDSLLLDLRRAFSSPHLGTQSIDVLCLGLGNPSVDRASLRQLALLDALLECDDRLCRARTRLYDPVFRDISRQFIRELGMQIISNNEEACYPLALDRYHFIMLPHCAPALLNNLLHTNWDRDLIGRVVLFSNGLKEVHNELRAAGASDSLIQTELGCLHYLEPIVTVGDCNQVYSTKHEVRDFEGMRIQWFKPDNLATLPSQVWNKANENVSNISTETTATPSSVQPTDLVIGKHFHADLITREAVRGFIDL